MANAKDSTKARTPRKSNTKRYTLSSVIVQYAKKRELDTAVAGKRVRAKLRGNFDKVCAMDASIKQAKSAANDGNRWPPVNDKVAEYILG